MLTLKKLFEQDDNLVCEFEKGERAGEKYVGKISVCANPICMCERVNLTLKLKSCNSPDSNHQLSYAFDIDLELHEPDKKLKKDSLVTYNFAKSLEDSLTEEGWESLKNRYEQIKTYESETCDPSTLEGDFPVDEIENTSLMVGYNII
jgi:hypothetical protein